MTDNLDQFAEVRKLYEKQYLPDENPNQEINEEINLNDYELAEEETEYNTYVSLLNIYTCYFKQLAFTIDNFTSNNQITTLYTDYVVCKIKK